MVSSLGCLLLPQDGAFQNDEEYFFLVVSSELGAGRLKTTSRLHQQLALGPGSMKIGSPSRDSLPEIERRADGTLNTVWLLKT